MEQSENVRNQKSYGRLKKIIKKYMQYHLQWEFQKLIDLHHFIRIW